MALHHRKKQKSKPSALPKEFLKTVESLFQKQFKKHLDGAAFLVFADLYPNEVILCISLAHPKSLRSVSVYISKDLKNATDSPEKVTEKLKSMVDLAASWFAQCFEKGDGLETVLAEMEDLSGAWESLEWDGDALFVLINRDNHVLENAANKFLRDSGIDPEEEEISEEDLEKAIEEMEDELGGHKLH